MTFYCPASDGLNGFGFRGYAGLGDNAPTGKAVGDYYIKGTKFLWLSPQTDFGFAWSTDPGADARNTLAAGLASLGYNVSTIFGERGGVLEVSGSQNIDRGHATDIRNQITQAAQKAGFLLVAPVQFNVENPATSVWQVGAPGSKTTWGDQTPVAPKSIFAEAGIDASGDVSFAGGTFKNIAIYAGLALLAFFRISKK